MELRKPSTWKWWVWALIILGIVLFAPSAGLVVLNVLTRGKRLTSTTADDNGDIPDDPDNLARAAADTMGIADTSVEAYSLARMCASEGESYSAATKAAICWVAVNVSNARNTSVTALLTDDTNSHGQGKYGQQSGRWASTINDPYEVDWNIALNVLTGATPDPTNGATHYFEPSLQDKLLALAKVSTSGAEKEAEWAQETGNPGFYIDGVDSRLEFFGPNGAPT
jgi:hypothetical protein